MPAVFDTTYVDAPAVRGIRFANLVQSFGDGFEQRANLNLAWTRATGTGPVSAMKGIFNWRLQFRTMEHSNNDITKVAVQIWRFYIARLGGWEPFYLYDPVEALTPDLTGASTIGRHLVVFNEQNLEFEEFLRNFCSGTITLREVRF
jgi:hypothetical protein